MVRRAVRVVIAFIVALAATMPVGAYAMPVRAEMIGTALDQLSQDCAQPDQGSSTNPCNMPGCQALVCAGAVAMLASPAVLSGRMLGCVLHNAAVPVRWNGMQPAPDPFPPKPAVQV